MDLDPTDVAEEIAALLEELGVPYVLGGSLASTLHGEPRALPGAVVGGGRCPRPARPLTMQLMGSIGACAWKAMRCVTRDRRARARPRRASVPFRPLGQPLAA